MILVIVSIQAEVGDLSMEEQRLDDRIRLYNLFYCEGMLSSRDFGLTLILTT